WIRGREDEREPVRRSDAPRSSRRDGVIPRPFGTQMGRAGDSGRGPGYIRTAGAEVNPNGSPLSGGSGAPRPPSTSSPHTPRKRPTAPTRTSPSPPPRTRYHPTYATSARSSNDQAVRTDRENQPPDAGMV